MEESRKKDTIKQIIIALIVMMVIIVVISYTYSFFQVEEANTTVIKGKVFSVNLSLEVNKITQSTELGLIPQLDSAITSAVVGKNNKSCIDDIGNEICQVYEIKVTNTSNVKLRVDGVVELNKGNNPNLKWARISNAAAEKVTAKPTLLSDINEPSYTTLMVNEEYALGEEKYYYIVIWISETGNTQSDSGDFSGVVKFKISEEITPSSTTLYALNLVSEIDTPNFTKTSCSEGCGEATVGIYPYEDDLGTSYYFRGDVENNYVKFGKNSSGKDMYWRIIRINGDGTVRMIYDGTQAWDNGISSDNDDRRIGSSVFNSSSNDNAYVGYMFGSVGVTETGITGYNLTHSNDNNSTIKTYLEGAIGEINTGWYYKNIVATGYNQYVADAIYCNDRSLDTGTGIGTTLTFYETYKRLWNNLDTSVEPKLICQNANDRFTINSSILETLDGLETNKKLKYPIGLITADELVLAGGKFETTINNKFYLYIGRSYWTMTPNTFSNSSNSTLVMRINGNGVLGNQYASSSSGVRPVISLKANVIKYGNGSKEQPFRISE